MNVLRKFANRTSLLVLLAVYAIFAVYIIPSSAAKMGAENPNAFGPLDLLFSYTPETAFEHMASYGDAGRAAYIKFSLVVDTAYPIVYTALFMVIIYLLAVRVWPAHAGRYLGRHKLALVPLLAFGFDLCENQSIVAMLKAYPNKPENIAHIGSIFTSLKWTSVALSFVIIVALLCIWALRKVRKQT